jgi:hypothetical protein
MHPNDDAPSDQTALIPSRLIPREKLIDKSTKEVAGRGAVTVKASSLKHKAI